MTTIDHGRALAQASLALFLWVRLLLGETTILGRIERNQDFLRESFGALTILAYQRSFEDCVRIVREALLNAD